MLFLQEVGDGFRRVKQHRYRDKNVQRTNVALHLDQWVGFGKSAVLDQVRDPLFDLLIIHELTPVVF